MSLGISSVSMTTPCTWLRRPERPAKSSLFSLTLAVLISAAHVVISLSISAFQGNKSPRDFPLLPPAFYPPGGLSFVRLLWYNGPQHEKGRT